MLQHIFGYLRSFLSILALAFIISACGGGGDSTPPVTSVSTPTLATVDDTNAQVIVQGFSKIVMGVVMGAEPLEDLAGIATYTCSNGTFDTALNMLANTATLNFADCDSSFTTNYSGQLIASNPTVIPLGFNVAFNELRIRKTEYTYPTITTDTMFVNGLVTVSLDTMGSTQTYSLTSPLVSVRSNGETHTLKNLNITVVKSAGTDTTISVTGTLSSTVFADAVQITTPVLLTKTEVERRYPYSGRMLFNGKRSYVAVTANGDSTFMPENNQTSLDINNVLTSHSWVDIRAWAGVLERFSKRH